MHNKKERIKNSLWGAFIGDALAMPVHWYYNSDNIFNDFGVNGIVSYNKPKTIHPEAFMIQRPYHPNINVANKLNRSVDIIHDFAKKFYDTTLSNPLNEETIKAETKMDNDEIGNTVAKKNQRYHYHYGLKKGDNTLGAHLCRLLIRNVIKFKENGDVYRNVGFLNDFVKYMDVRNNDEKRLDNDAYVEEYIRIFFENYSNGNDIQYCSGNQQNKWDINGNGSLTRSMILSILYHNNINKGIGISIEHLNCLNRSENSVSALVLIIPMLLGLLNGKYKTYTDAINDCVLPYLHLPKITGKELLDMYLKHNGPKNIDKKTTYLMHTEYEEKTFDPYKYINNNDDSIIGERLTTACYTEHGIPMIIYIMLRFNFDIIKCLLYNTNIGGDNVHRSMIIGLLIGAGMDKSNKEFERLKRGLSDYHDIKREIDRFADLVCTKKGKL